MSGEGSSGRLVKNVMDDWGANDALIVRCSVFVFSNYIRKWANMIKNIYNPLNIDSES